MSKAQLVITAVVLEGRSKSQVAGDYHLSRYWVHQLVTRYHADGQRRSSPAPGARTTIDNRHAVSADVEDRIVRLRKATRARAWVVLRGPLPRWRPSGGVALGPGQRCGPPSWTARSCGFCGA